MTCSILLCPCAPVYHVICVFHRCTLRNRKRFMCANFSVFVFTFCLLSFHLLLLQNHTREQTEQQNSVSSLIVFHDASTQYTPPPHRPPLLTLPATFGSSPLQACPNSPMRGPISCNGRCHTAYKRTYFLHTRTLTERERETKQ